MIAYCLLGSNLGNRADHLRQAVFYLADTPRIDVLQSSHIYETPPWGKMDQPAFLNAAVEIQTSLEPRELLKHLQEIEQRLGRRRAQEQRWGPRTMDIDLALYGDEVLEYEDLTIPHPRLPERAFALVPLLELSPELRDPRTGANYADSLKRLGSEAAESCRTAGPLLRDASIFRDENTVFEQGLYISRLPEDTRHLAQTAAAEMRGGEVIAMVGNLGAGKTCFAGGFAHGLGIRRPITSPSYVLVKSYEEGRLTLHHADFYRLAETIYSETSEPPDLASLGLEDYLDDRGAVVLVEWADRFPSWMEPPYWLVQIAGSGLGPRVLLVTLVDR